MIVAQRKPFEEIKNLPFDHYQIYDCTPEEIKFIKNKTHERDIWRVTLL